MGRGSVTPCSVRNVEKEHLIIGESRRYIELVAQLFPDSRRGSLSSSINGSLFRSVAECTRVPIESTRPEVGVVPSERRWTGRHRPATPRWRLRESPCRRLPERLQRVTRLSPTLHAAEFGESIAQSRPLFRRRRTDRRVQALPERRVGWSGRTTPEQRSVKRLRRRTPDPSDRATVAWTGVEPRSYSIGSFHGGEAVSLSCGCVIYGSEPMLSHRRQSEQTQSAVHAYLGELKRSLITLRAYTSSSGAGGGQ